MELRTDLMKMADLDKFRAILDRYKNIPDIGLVFGLTDNAKGSWWAHEDENRWEEMTLLFVTKSRDDVKAAAEMFRKWAYEAWPQVPCYQVGVEDDELPEGSSRYWLYILR
jgi:hypothetical protein